MNTYEKLKHILKAYTKNPLKKEDIIDESKKITFDNVREALTIYRSMGILKSSGVSGYNKFVYFIDKEIYNNKNYNICIIASLAHAKDEESKDILQYLFKTVKKNIEKSLTWKYQKRLDNSLLGLIKSKKYQFILRVIEHNQQEAIKIKYNVKISGDIIELIPLDIIIKDKDWFLFSYNVVSHEYQFNNLKEVTFLKYINDSTELLIRKPVEDFIEQLYDDEKLHEIEVKLNPFVLNSLIKMNLIEDFELFEEEMDMQMYGLSLGKGVPEFIKKKIKNIKDEFEIDNLRRDVFFNEPDEINKKFVAKIKVKNEELKIIMKLYPEIFVRSNSSEIEFCKCCNRPIGISRKC